MIPEADSAALHLIVSYPSNYAIQEFRPPGAGGTLLGYSTRIITENFHTSNLNPNQEK